MKSHPPKAPTSSQLRIIGGQWRGRKLSFPAVEGLRPTGDRIRETVFNWLQADLPQARCLDLFAGSGALGLEALSRGCQSCTLLELNKSAWRQLQINAQLLNAIDIDILNVDSLAWLGLAPDKPFDIIFVDPPFAADLWQTSIAALNERGFIASGGAIYIETPRDRDLEVPAHWQLAREKKSGDVCYRLYRLL